MLPKYKLFSSFIVICFLFVFLVSINSSAASSWSNQASKAVKQATKAAEQAAVQPSSSEGAQGLTSLAIPPNEYITTEMDAALQAAQQKAKEFAQQALDTFNAAKAAAEAAKQEDEEFANQVTEAAELAKQSTESAKDAVQAAQQALEELSKQAGEAKVAADAAKAEVQAARKALERLANQATAPTPQVPEQPTEVLANQAIETAMAAKAALQAAQQAAEELAKQAGEALLAVEAAKQTVQQEKEIFANNMAEAVMNAEATALEAQQKAQELRSKITEAQEKVQQAKETLETARQDVASGNYGEALLVILGAYTGKSDEIQTTLDQLEKLVTASETLYDLGSQAKACVDGNGADYCIQEKLPDPHVPTMSDMGSALDVANLRCSEQVPSKIATVLGRVVGLEGQFDTEEFETKRATVCQAIEKIYNLKYKLQQLEEIREDGFSLLYKYDKKKIKKDGISRTVQHSLDLRFYPDIQESYNTGDISPEFSLDNENSWFKWSDSDKKYLGDILDSSKTEDTGDAACSDSKPYWFKLADRLKFRLKVSSVTSSDVTLTACLRVSWKGNHSRELATVTIPAPFGYLDEVTQMKDDAVQGAMNSLTDQIADMLGINDKLDDIANQAADAQAAAQSKSGTSNQPPNGRS